MTAAPAVLSNGKPADFKRRIKAGRQERGSKDIEYRAEIMKRDFTLVELLVVIVVIAILAGLLLSALNTSRSKAKRIQDLSNMRQVGIGLHSYSDASNGYMPCADVWLENGLREFCTGGNTAWIQFPPADARARGLGLLFAGGYVTNPRIFFCTEPLFDGYSCYAYDNPVNGWANNWNQSGKHVFLSICLPMLLYSEGDLAAAKAYWATRGAGMSEFPMSNILSDNAGKVVLSCYVYKYSSDAKLPHNGDGVNMIFGDNSGRWRKIDETALAADGGYGAARLFAWLNANASL